jgi:glutaminyl-peptide cyclotransferase
MGWIDLSGLHDLALQASQAPVPPEVPNGIAYDPATKRIFVTGKFWPTLYEITLTPAEVQP